MTARCPGLNAFKFGSTADARSGSHRGDKRPTVNPDTRLREIALMLKWKGRRSADRVGSRLLSLAGYTTHQRHTGSKPLLKKSARRVGILPTQQIPFMLRAFGSTVSPIRNQSVAAPATAPRTPPRNRDPRRRAAELTTPYPFHDSLSRACRTAGRSACGLLPPRLRILIGDAPTSATSVRTCRWVICSDQVTASFRREPGACVRTAGAAMDQCRYGNDDGSSG